MEMLCILLQSDGTDAIFLLQNEIAESINLKNQEMPELKCYQWLCDLAFLTDIMSHLNSFSLHLQGVGKFVSSLRSCKSILKKTGLAAKTTK